MIQVSTPGHRYFLPNQEDGDGQFLQFLHKEPIEEGSTTLKTISDGTTNEDVIEALIDRLSFLQSKFPCKHNACAITHLQEAKMRLEERTRERLKRKVEGKNIA